VNFLVPQAFCGPGNVVAGGYGRGMNRTDRLYALTEELRSASPAARSGRWLARHFMVSVRTVERDVAILQSEGVPVHATPGRAGGYRLDRAWAWPHTPTPEEALALALAVRSLAGTPFHQPAQAGLHRLLATLPPHELATLRDLAAHLPLPTAPADTGVLHLRYHSADGEVTERDVEPLGVFGNDEHWYLIAWCRLRAAIRGFRLDRIAALAATGEPAPDRPVALGGRVVPSRDLAALHIPEAA
jgi:predicted DNA-binding transcriptional regulator YafY